MSFPIPVTRVGVGQDSHRFLPADSAKPCVVAGLIFGECPGLSADSDGDVAFHAICNAISSVTGVQILGGIAIDLCHKGGITDSQVYLEKAMETLGAQVIQHVALTIEGQASPFSTTCRRDAWQHCARDGIKARSSGLNRHFWRRSN